MKGIKNTTDLIKFIIIVIVLYVIIKFVFRLTGALLHFLTGGFGLLIVLGLLYFFVFKKKKH